MANLNAIAVIRSVTDQGVTPGNPPTLRLVVELALHPEDGSTGLLGGVEVARSVNTTAAQWRQGIIDQVKAYAAAPVGSPDTYTITRMVGLIDIATVANP